MGTIKQILSLGAGVQSTAVFLMSCRGLLPKLDLAIFADTQWEPAEVYTHLAWLEELGRQHGIPVHRVTAGNLRDDVIGWQALRDLKKRRARLPLYVLNKDGSQGIIQRQCTQVYKIEPQTRFIRSEVLGLKKGQRAPRSHVIDHWFGISADEPQRMRDSRDPWARNVYPLCGIPDQVLPKVFTRRSCMVWLAEHYPGRQIPRSACIACPYHSDEEWRRIRQHPQEWADAVAFDDAIRGSDGINGACFVHAARVPLDQVDLSTDYDRGQGALWGNECAGMCGV